MRTRVSLPACAILIFASLVCAQEQTPSLKNAPAKSSVESAPPLALEIHYNSSLNPAFLMVQGADVNPHWIWFTRFSKLPGFDALSGPTRINAVRVTSYWNGETAEVKVTLLRGIHMADEEEIVTTYKTRLDEPATITKLESYGIEPFKITLVMPKTAAPPPPNLDNRTTSVQIVKVDTEGVPLPAYRPTLRNTSNKDIAALQMDVTLDGRPGPSSFRQGDDGAALIPSNQVREEYINAFVPEKERGSFTPAPTQANVLIVSGVVFTDGTFEGDVGRACMYESFVYGRTMWLREALKIIDEALTDPDDTKAAQELIKGVQAIRYISSNTDRRLQSAVSPRCPSPTWTAPSTFAGLNNSFINEVGSVVTTRAKPLITLKVWLEATRKRYRQWLQNLEVFPSPRAVAAR